MRRWVVRDVEVATRQGQAEAVEKRLRWWLDGSDAGGRARRKRAQDSETEPSTKPGRSERCPCTSEAVHTSPRRAGQASGKPESRRRVAIPIAPTCRKQSGPLALEGTRNAGKANMYTGTDSGAPAHGNRRKDS